MNSYRDNDSIGSLNKSRVENRPVGSDATKEESKMDKYELVVIVDATLQQEEKESVVKETCDIITKCEGHVINNQVWLDKHRFTFRMKKRTEGTYYLINFDSPRSSLVKMRQNLKLHDKILRSLIIKVE
jgi:small subunit ribosomal protein S6